MKVRPGTAADVPRAIEIWRSAVKATHDFLSTEDRALIDAEVANHYLPNAKLWLALDDADRPVGFLELGDEAIEALFVDGEVQGQGYGTLLLDHARALVPKLRVDANEQASNAVQFYVSRGFRIVGRSPTDDRGRNYPLVHLALTE